ncbi:MAG TPA: S41 family peptidase [Propionibacteriaceae bacterium]|nr:S41 family peptidase [Propionibacteriaceae bacterium]
MISYLRYPHVHGDDVVFTADDDIWIAPLAGGRASRLTTEHLPARGPRFSPSGRRIAWAVELGGRPDVRVLDLDTGEISRITWWSTPGTTVVGWADDEHVVVASAHAQHYNRLSHLYSVGLDATVTPLSVGPAMGWAPGPDGRLAINTPNNRDSAMWKRYRGGTASQLWLRRDDRWSRLLAEETAGMYSPGWFAGRLFFSSDLEASLEQSPLGQAQVCSVDADGADLQVHTHHRPDEGYVRNPTTDGSTIVYHAHGRLYALDSLDAAPRRIEVDLALGAPARETVSAQHNLDHIVPDHGGDASLVGWRGAAYLLTHRSGPARALSALPGVRTREPDLLGRTGLGVWATDAEGEDCLEIAPLTGEGDPRRICGGELGRVLHLRSNPAGTHVGVISHDGTVRVVAVDDGKSVVAGRSVNGEATGLAWSPDGRYLVWRNLGPESVDGMIGRLVCFDTTAPGQEAVGLTSGRFNDSDPVFTRDGKFLVFLSQRTLDPHYDELGFDLAFGESVRPWLVPLRADQPAPFGPSADGWPISESEHEKGEGSSEGDDAHDKETVPAVEIDLEGFEERLVPFPVPSGDYDDLGVCDGGVVWLRRHEPHGVLGAWRSGAEGDDPGSQVERFGFDHRKVEVIVPRADGFAVSGDGKHLVVRVKDDLLVVPSDHSVEDDDPARVTVDLSRLRRQVGPRDEFRQMFDENARLMRDHYWRADMDGNDWHAITERYRPLVEGLRTHDDLVDLLWEVVAELNTSHSYVVPPTEGIDASERVGLLGADLEPVEEGARIVRILPGESSDPAARSPLRAAGVAARVGDVITAVNGESVADAAHIGELLQGTAGRIVELSLLREGTTRRVAVVPLAEEETIRYHDWVARNADYVRRQSGGRVGYVHVPDMMGLGWAQLRRMLDAASRCEGVVADMRYNRGGHTSQLVIELLSRRVIGWDLARHYESPFTYPYQAMRGPVVFVANRYSGSDGDIVNAVAQAAGLGPVVGERTWGGVIGIDGRFDLLDGTEVTQPRYASWLRGYGYGLENHGVDPDVEVVPDPDQWQRMLTGPESDVQLDRAIAEVLARLAEHPADTPPELPAPRVHG